MAETPNDLYDRILKAYVKQEPAMLLEALLSPDPARQVKPLDAELVVPRRIGDVVLEVEDRDGKYLLHIEFENEADATMPFRMLAYHALLRLHAPGLDVRSVLFLLKTPEHTFDDRIEVLRGGETTLLFRFRIERIYQQRPEALASSRALSVFTPLGHGFARERPEEQRRMLERAVQTIREGGRTGMADRLWGLQLLAERARVSERIIHAIFLNEEVRMALSYQDAVQEGVDKGHAEKQTALLQRLIERKYPRARAGLVEVTAWLPLCDDGDADWIFDNAGTGTFAEFKAGLEKRLKKRGVL